MKRTTTNSLILAIVAVVFLATAGAATLLSRPVGDELPASISMTAVSQTEQGVEPDSAFQLTSGYRVKKEQLTAMLSVEPELKFAVEGSGKNWTLKPSEPLKVNTVYTFRVLNETKNVVQSFAFQTKSDLLVNSVYPADESTYVDPKTGIEFTFNAAGVNIEDYFEILPAVAGTFETNDYTVTFIPSAPLAENSIYRATLKAGLPAPNGTALREDYTFSFETSSPERDKWDYTRLRLAGEFSETFLPGDTLAVEVTSGSDVTGVEFDVKMYQFPDADTYIKVLNERDKFYAERYGVLSDYIVDTSGLQEVVNYHGELLHQGEETWTSSYAVLPDNIEEGYYIVAISGKDAEGADQFVQKLVQIRNLSVYTQSVNGDTLVWVNDPSSGGALSGLTINLIDKKTGNKLEATTQEDGTVRLLTGEVENAQLQVLRDGKPAYVEELSLSKEEEKTPLNQQYYTALYTDREIYQPNDTIRFWGTVKPRTVTNTMPQVVYASLGSGLYQMKVSVGADGTFSGEMKITGVRKDWYSFTITDGKDETYTSKGFEIRDYEKPAYVIEVKTDKNVYYYNETVRFEVSANFFDGTPVAGGKLRLSGYGMTFGASGESKVITLDASGKATVSGMLDTSVNRDQSGMYGWSPQNIYYTVSNAQEEDVFINTSGSFYALPSKVAAQVTAGKDGKTLTVETAQLEGSKVGQAGGIVRPMVVPSEFEQLKGAPVDLPVAVLIHKTEFIQTPIGSFYDSVNKKTVQRYKTESRESVERVLNGYTSGGKAVFNDVPYANDVNVFYWYEAQFSGGIVGHVSAKSYPGRLYSLPEEFQQISSYAFVDESAGGEHTELDFMRSRSFDRAAMDEPIVLGLYKNGVKVENKGSMLCSAVQSKVLRNTVTREDALTFTMSEEFLPNVRFTGAYFDGRHVYRINDYDVSYNYDEKMLNIEAKAEQSSYRPGEKAKIMISVTDKTTGKPAAASVCIGVVDEAVFQLAQQTVDLAGQIYQSVFYPNLVRSVSYKEYNLERDSIATGGKGGGGGDSDPLREDFVDTALFQTVAVDESGKAEVELTLPDNVTSWRITAAGVTQDLKAGDTTANAVATLPFYLRPLFTDTYLVGDDVVFSLGGVGTAIKTEESVDYTATVFDADSKQIDQKTASGKAGERTAFNLGKYDEGAYTLRLEGKCGENSDAVQIPFSVVKQEMTVSQIDTIHLDQLQTLSSVTYPVKLSIYDKRMAAFMDGIQRLSGQSGARTEVLAAAYRAQVLYNELLPEEEQIIVRKDARLDTIQEMDGESGVKLLPIGESDASVTAKMLIAAPELINKWHAVAYLKSVLADAASTPNDRVMAYTGLAAAKSPVLLDITRMLKENADLTTAQKLYLGSGLAQLGDFTSAEAIYSALKESDAVVTETNLKYLTGATNDERLENTAAALMLTSIISNPDADALMNDLNAQDNDRSASYTTLTNLEMLTYLEKFTLPEGEKTGKFSYVINGETKEETLDSKGVKVLSLSAETFRNTQFKVLSGSLFAAVRHTVYAGDLDVPPTSKLTISKTYTPVDGEFKTSGKVRVDLKVTFSDNAPSGCYQITDFIPSGMRYLPASNMSSPWYDWGWSSMENDGQTVRGYAYRDNSKLPGSATDIGDGDAYAEENPSVMGGGEAETPNVFTLTYYASCVLPGEFVAESAYVTPNEAGISAKSERTTITIQPNL